MKDGRECKGITTQVVEEKRMENQYIEHFENYNEMIRLYSNNSFAYLCRGLAYIMISQYDNAINDFCMAIKIDPDNPFSYYFWGRAYWFSGQVEQAKKDTQKAIEIAPDIKFAKSALEEYDGNS
jgi:tetratricopeptide (TPR) repeat protein